MQLCTLPALQNLLVFVHNADKCMCVCVCVCVARNDPSTTVKKHIRLLHEYNEIKDVGQGLMGLIADARNVRQIEVQREFGVGDRD